MNGVTDLDLGDCEYVEVDPTGRYGRVKFHISHLLLLVYLYLLFYTSFDHIWLCVHLLINSSVSLFCSIMKFLAEGHQR